MNREALKALGLTEEQIEAVMKSHGVAIGTVKNDLDAVKLERDGLKTDIKDRDKQLDDLKKIDPEGLQKEIERLKQVNLDTSETMQKALDDQAFEFALEKALGKAGAKNPKAVKALLELETLKLDGNKILGLDTQLEKLSKDEDYLFESKEEPAAGKLKGRNPNEPAGKAGGKAAVNPFAKETFNLTEQGRLFKEDPEQYKLLKAQA